MRVPSLRPWFAASLLALAATLPAQKPVRPKLPKPGEATTILFVGNSYTHFHDLPGCVQALGRAESPPREITVRMLAPGGCTLEQHWQATGDDAPRKVIQAMRPDFVVLQEQSRMPLDDPERMQKYAARLARVVAKYKAEPVWYATWARQHEPERQDEIGEQYAAAQKKNGGRLAPVGRAWQLVFASDAEQSLHMPDRSHPNPQGSYLAACVLFATMFGGDVTTFPDKLGDIGPDGKPRVLIELEPAVGRRLRAAAKQALDEAGKGARRRPKSRR